VLDGEIDEFIKVFLLKRGAPVAGEPEGDDRP
jgi:hypothetical protein